MQFTLLEHGEVFAPEPLGVTSLLFAGSEIVRMGTIDVQGLDRLGLPYRIVDATGCVVIPGLIDAHSHLIGAGGEQGFGSRMAEVEIHELVQSGITTVIGCLGTDTVTRQLPSLLGKVRQLEAQGLTAFLYTGGFQVPPPTLTGSVMSDLVLIEKVIGVGEVAISDVRSTQPTLSELARLCADAYVGGTLSAKAGVTHFHIGPGRQRLAPLHALLDQYEVVPAAIFATHISRSEALFEEAIGLARRGAYVDVDTIDEDLPRWLKRYRDVKGPGSQLTASSDSHTKGGTPAKLYGQLVACHRELGLPLAELLPLFTCNPASVLKLERKGRLRENMDADVVVMSKDELQIRYVFARGAMLFGEGIEA
jgi:beta-aspartyl-dipeptidase (metallo-type)